MSWATETEGEPMDEPDDVDDVALLLAAAAVHAARRRDGQPPGAPPDERLRTAWALLDAARTGRYPVDHHRR